MAQRGSFGEYNKLRESPVNVKVQGGGKQREVVIKKEESFIKGYQTIRTFFEAAEFKQICELNSPYITK